MFYPLETSKSTRGIWRMVIPFPLENKFLYNIKNINIILYYIIIWMEEGRPIQMSSGNRGTAISLYLDSTELKVLEEIRWRERKSLSAMVRMAIDEYLKNHAVGNDTYKIDEYIRDPEFQAVPAYFSDRETWKKHYENSSEKDKTKLRMKNVEQAKLFRQVDIQWVK